MATNFIKDQKESFNSFLFHTVSWDLKKSVMKKRGRERRVQTETLFCFDVLIKFPKQLREGSQVRIREYSGTCQELKGFSITLPTATHKNGTHPLQPGPDFPQGNLGACLGPGGFQGVCRQWTGPTKSGPHKSTAGVADITQRIHPRSHTAH